MGPKIGPKDGLNTFWCYWIATRPCPLNADKRMLFHFGPLVKWGQDAEFQQSPKRRIQGWSIPSNTQHWLIPEILRLTLTLLASCHLEVVCVCVLPKCFNKVVADVMGWWTTLHCTPWHLFALHTRHLCWLEAARTGIKLWTAHSCNSFITLNLQAISVQYQCPKPGLSPNKKGLKQRRFLEGTNFAI